MKAIQITEFGGPEVLKHVELPDPEPGEGQLVVEVSRAGVNFADTHMTRNDYLANQELPLVPGGEIAGTTPDGRRVASLLGGGGYAEKVAVPEAFLVPLPDDVSDEQAAGSLLQGTTAEALVKQCARLQPDETIVIEAAAGGTGSLAVQIAKRAGGRVIALASTEEKRALTERLGADAAIDSRLDAGELGEAILAANDGKQVDAVLQMSGAAAFDAELRVLAPFGRMVAFGNASREDNTVKTGHLMRNSRAVIGFWLVHLMMRRDLAAPLIGDLFAGIAGGELEVVIGETYPLSEAARAHEAIAARKTQGKLLLDPSR